MEKVNIAETIDSISIFASVAQPQVSFSVLEPSLRSNNSSWFVLEEMQDATARNNLCETDFESIIDQAGGDQLFDRMLMRQHKQQQNKKWSSPQKTWKFKFKSCLEKDKITSANEMFQGFCIRTVCPNKVLFTQTSLEKFLNVLTTTSSSLRELVSSKWHFGHEDFRGKQLEAIQVVSCKECFCLMPMEVGKSICYQILAVAKSRIVRVVSPLIAWMENQVMMLKEKLMAVEYVSSTQTTHLRNKIYEDLDSGKLSVSLLGSLKLIVIDKLSGLRDASADVQVWTLAATAGPKIQEEMDSNYIEQLYCSFKVDDNLYIVMEYLTSGDMMTLLMTKNTSTEECGRVEFTEDELPTLLNERAKVSTFAHFWSSNGATVGVIILLSVSWKSTLSKQEKLEKDWWF